MMMMIIIISSSSSNSSSRSIRVILLVLFSVKLLRDSEEQRMESKDEMVFSERELAFTFAICYRRSVCLSSVCLSVTLVRPTRSVEIFSAIFLRRLVPMPSIDIHGKFYGDRPGGTPPSGV